MKRLFVTKITTFDIGFWVITIFITPLSSTIIIEA